MTVLVDKHPRRLYQTFGGRGSTQEERERADLLDQLLEKRIDRLVKRLEKDKLAPEKAGKASVATYWMLGQALREVASNEDLFNQTELPLLWRNAKMYLPETLLYKDRGPYREHLWYCYRLGAYPRKIAVHMNWGEWVTIFDSTGINQEPRFDTWFVTKLSEKGDRITREQIRIFAPCVNAMLGNIDIHDLGNTELENCYEACWSIMKVWSHKKSDSGRYKIERKELQSGINELMGKLDHVMNGDCSPQVYAEEVVALAENV